MGPKNLFELSGFRVTVVFINLLKSHWTKESVRFIRFSSYRVSSYPVFELQGFELSEFNCIIFN